MCIRGSIPNPTEAGVWWRDDDVWCIYSPAQQAQIHLAIQENRTSVDLGSIISDAHPEGANYVVDLQNMQQRNTSSGTGMARPVLLVDSTPLSSPSNGVASQVCFYT